MAAEQSSWTLGELAQILGAELVGPAEAVILRPVGAGTNDPSGITFAESDKYFPKIIGSGVGACLVPLGTGNLGVPLLRVRSPRAAFGMMLGLAARPLTLPPGVHPTAQIDPTAQVDKTAKIGAFCVVGAEATIGAGSEIHSGCFVGDRCVVGEHTTLKPGVTLVKDVTMGMACLIHSGAVLGAPGFGFAFDGKKHMHIPQVGGVLLGDFVEIGANTCVDRATVGNTEIGTGTKIDNLVHIAHNCKIGEHTVIAAQCGFAGSVTLGSYCVLAGRVVFRDHVTVTDRVVLGGGTQVASDILVPGEYFGPHQLPIRTGIRQRLIAARLPELWERVRKLEAKNDL